MHEFFHWLAANMLGQFVFGVVGNLVASALAFILGGHWLLKKHLKPHFQKVADLHAELQKETH